MFRRVFWDFLRPCLQRHLLINRQISSSKNLPANRKRDYLSETANGILKMFVATPSFELKSQLKSQLGARKKLSKTARIPIGKLSGTEASEGPE
jgi:hypothetical protein